MSAFHIGGPRVAQNHGEPLALLASTRVHACHIMNSWKIVSHFLQYYAYWEMYLAHLVGHAAGKAALSDRIAVFEQANSEISLATDILVVGGGPIGIEMAGEIKEAFPDKKITLVTSQELMHSPDVPFPDRFRERLRAKLESLEVTVHTGVGRVSLDPSDINECGFIPGKKVYKWDGGEMEADLCIVATGSRQVPPLYQDSGLGEWINERGYIKASRELGLAS